MENITHISRDPFAREEIIRMRVPIVFNGASCSFCGQVKHSGKARNPYLFQYGIERDSGARAWSKGLFCSIGCYRLYHGL
jgi:hypothetical protein